MFVKSNARRFPMRCLQPLFPYAAPYLKPDSYEIIHHAPPIIPAITPVVKNPAPTLSPVVMTVVSSVGLVALPLPALGFPLLVPPVVFVSGAWTCWIRFDWITSRADISWPIPLVPSHVALLVHFRPHVLPLAPPEHCRAAAVAEVLSLSMIVLYVHGAIFVVAAIHRDRYALKDN